MSAATVMSQPIVFSDILDAAEQLDTDAHAELVAILSRRLAERGRARVAATVAQARAEFAANREPAAESNRGGWR